MPRRRVDGLDDRVFRGVHPESDRQGSRSRYADASEFRDDLERFLDRRPIRAPYVALRTLHQLVSTPTRHGSSDTFIGQSVVPVIGSRPASGSPLCPAGEPGSPQPADRRLESSLCRPVSCRCLCRAGPPFGVTFAGDGGPVVTFGRLGAQFWDPTTGHELIGVTRVHQADFCGRPARLLQERFSNISLDRAASVDLSPDGRFLVSVAADLADVGDPATGRRIDDVGSRPRENPDSRCQSHRQMVSE